MFAPLPPNKPDRLAAPPAGTWPDPEADAAFDDLVRLAARLCQMPLAAVSLIDAGRPRCQARHGLAGASEGVEEFCTLTLRDPARLTVVPDATQDPRWADHPLVTGAPHLRCYAGAPLVTRDGLALGCLCVIDTVPRTLDAGQRDALTILARQVTRQIEAQQVMQQLADAKTALDHHAIVAVVDRQGRFTFVNEPCCTLSRYSRAELLAASDLTSRSHPGHAFFSAARATVSRGLVWRGEVCAAARDGSPYWLETTIVPAKNAAGRTWQYVLIGTDLTQRKHAEIALRASEEKFRQLADHITDVFWMASPDNQTLHYVSPGYAAIWGRTTESLRADPRQWSDAIVPEDRAAAFDAFRRLGSGEPAVSVEFRIARPDGTVRWIHDRGYQVRDAAGHVVRLTGICTDITERKRHEQAIQRQQTELRTLLDAVPALILFKDTKNTILRANQRVADACGKTLAEIEGQSCAVAFPEDAARFYLNDLAVIRSGLPKLGYVETVRGRDGQERWVQTDKVPYRDATGAVAGIVVLVQDITRRRADEESLRLLSSALQQAKESIVITDAQLDLPGPRILFVNAAFTALTGYTSAEMLGRTPRLFQGPRSDRAVLARLRTTLAQGGTFAGETINYRKDGTPYDVEWQVAPIRDDQGTLTHFVAVQRDISKRKAAELELARARDAALEATRLKSRFLANMSHELRTPLNTINGLSATLIEQDLPPDARQVAALILQCGEALLQNIQTILTHATLEAGKHRPDPKPFALAEVVLNALRITDEAAQRRGLGVDFRLDPMAPAVVIGDAFHLQQVLVNLLANAIKFTDQGRVHLQLRAHAEPGGSWRLRFAVIDSGIGISRADQARLFEPFAQADDSPTRRFEGTGLGLAITKSLVELMGGRISVASRPGRGSIFRFVVTLPAVPDSPRIFAAAAHPLLAGRRVLILEPNPVRRQQLLAMTAAWQMHATAPASGSAESAADACDLVIQRAPKPGQPPVPPVCDPTGAPRPVVWLTTKGYVHPAVTGGRWTEVYIPFSPGELSEALVSLLRAEPRASTAGAPAPHRVKLGTRLPLRVLGADDIHSNRAVLKVICRHLGYEIDLVENGAEVLRQLALQPYDLLLLDVQMPVLDGLAATREICRLHPDPADRPRIVAVTASVQPGDRELCLAAGMDDYLSKPVLPRQLQACIERLFAPHADAAPSAPVPVAAPPRDPVWLDHAHLQATTDGLAPAEAHELLTGLFAAARADFATLRPRLAAECAGHESGPLAASVHGLKGCALSLGWTHLGSRCVEVLQALRADRFTAWDEFPGECEELYRGSARAMATLLRDSPDLPCRDPAAAGPAEPACPPRPATAGYP